MTKAYIEQAADDQVLPVMLEYPGDKLTSTEVKRLGELKLSDNTIIEALDFLESAGEVISSPATPEKPKRWVAIEAQAIMVTKNDA